MSHKNKISKLMSSGHHIISTNNCTRNTANYRQSYRLPNLLCAQFQKGQDTKQQPGSTIVLEQMVAHDYPISPIIFFRLATHSVTRKAKYIRPTGRPRGYGRDEHMASLQFQQATCIRRRTCIQETKSFKQFLVAVSIVCLPNRKSYHYPNYAHRQQSQNGTGRGG